MIEERPMYYKRDGTPYRGSWESIARQWALDFSKNKRVCRTEFKWGGFLSTVWLGLDHNFAFGRPLIFESMLFDKKNDDLGCWRYSTEKEAIAGHSRLVRKYSKAPPK